MKKIVLIFLLFGWVNAAFSQQELRKAIQTYYRYDPFERSFSNFITNLISDGALINKTIVKRTDTTLFFFRGDYKGHNPFGFKASRTEVRLAEMEISSSDTSTQKDTIMAYQILGYVARSTDGMLAVKKEFTRFDKKYGAQFANKSIKDLMNGNNVEGITCNYFLNYSPVSPLTVIWGNINENESIFAITIRLMKSENQAILPVLHDANSQVGLN